MKAITEAEVRRTVELKVWMRLNNVSSVWAGKELGVRQSTAYDWLFRKETILPEHRERLIELGFPSELLPPGEVRKPGPQPKIPFFVTQSSSK